MIQSTTKLRMKRWTRKEKMSIRKIATNTISINKFKDELQVSINDRLAEIPVGTVEEKWNAFKSIVYKVSKDKLDTAVKKNRDWSDRKSMKLKDLINNRNQARINKLNENTKSAKAGYEIYCQLLRQRCRELKNKWWLTKAAELQTLANYNDPKGPRLNHPEQLLALNNKTIIIEKHEILVRWKDRHKKRKIFVTIISLFLNDVVQEFTLTSYTFLMLDELITGEWWTTPKNIHKDYNSEF